MGDGRCNAVEGAAAEVLLAAEASLAGCYSCWPHCTSELREVKALVTRDSASELLLGGACQRQSGALSELREAKALQRAFHPLTAAATQSKEHRHTHTRIHAHTHARARAHTHTHARIQVRTRTHPRTNTPLDNRVRRWQAGHLCWQELMHTFQAP